MTAKPKREPMRKNTTEPHPLFSGNPAQYTDDVQHRPEDDDDTDKTPAAMAQRGRWNRQ